MQKPNGKLALKIVAMPADTNANGDIFGGWLVSIMDMAAGIEARNLAQSRSVTVAIDSLVFLKKVLIGDVVSCYSELIKVGNTSMQFKIEVWTLSLQDECEKKAAHGFFTFVAINAEGKPHPVKR